MNERIKTLLLESKIYDGSDQQSITTCLEDLKKFAELIIKECEKLNRRQSYELAGVIADVELGAGFDDISLDTVKRVEKYLHGNSLATNFADSYIDPNRDQTL